MTRLIIESNLGTIPKQLLDVLQYYTCSEVFLPFLRMSGLA